MEFKLSANNKRLWRKIKNSRSGVYHASMSQSEQDRVSVLLKLGLVEETFGSWTGERIYRSRPQCTQASGHSS